MNEIQVFSSEQFGQVRVQVIENEPCFVAKDVCDILEIKNSRDAISRLDDDEKGVALIDTLGGSQGLAYVTESGLYSLILSSRKKTAKPFQRWITHEVVPSIRKTGGYLAGQDQMSPEQMVIASMEWLQKQLTEKQSQIDTLTPKALVADTLKFGEGDMHIGTLAKYIAQTGVNIGQNRLFKTLAADGYIFKSEGGYVPTQRAIEQGLLTMKRSEVTIEGKTILKTTVMVSPKGVDFFVRKYGRKE